MCKIEIKATGGDGSEPEGVKKVAEIQIGRSPVLDEMNAHFWNKN